MSRYIAAGQIDRQYKIYKEKQYGDVEEQLTDEEILRLLLLAIDACPTADVVEVVRCKDCKHLMAEKSNSNPHIRWCTHHGWRTDEWWCGDGERKTDG